MHSRLRTSLRMATFALALVFGVSQHTAAQITLTSSDLLGLIGTSQRLVQDTTGNVTVNVGSPGANQTWDLTSVVPSGIATDRSFLNPSQTPFAADFPTANFVIEVGGDDFPGVIYQYNLVETNGLTELGVGLVSFDPDTSFVESSTEEEIVMLPLSYNDGWTETERDTVGDIATFAIVSYDSTINIFDGWGTVQLGVGSYQALRLRADDYYTTETWAAGIMVSSETSTSISYEWITATHFLVAAIESHDGETDPNFTDAESVEMLTAITTSTEGDVPGTDGAALLATYPNPFSSEMTVQYEASGSQVDLAVYDLLGRRVRTLDEGLVPSGNRVVAWDGKTDGGSSVANGVYLVRLEAGDRIDTRRVVLVR